MHVLEFRFIHASAVQRERDELRLRGTWLLPNSKSGFIKLVRGLVFPGLWGLALAVQGFPL